MTIPRFLNIGFTGTQRGMSLGQFAIFAPLVRELIYQQKRPAWFHHGDCIGSDAEAHERARFIGCSIYLHPPADSSKRAFCLADYEAKVQHYLVRNAQIVAASDYMFACPGEDTEQSRSGTWSTIRRAREHLRPLSIIFPDGTIKLENWP